MNDNVIPFRKPGCSDIFDTTEVVAEHDALVWIMLRLADRHAPDFAAAVIWRALATFMNRHMTFEDFMAWGEVERAPFSHLNDPDGSSAA